MGKNEGVKKMMEQWPLKVRGERVRDVRDSLGLSLRQLGDLCDLSVPALSRFERGELELSLGAFGRVQDALAELLSPENLIRNQKRFQEFASYFIGAIPEWKGVEPDAVVRAGIISFMRKRLGADWKDLVTAAWEVMGSEKAAQVKKPGWLAGAIGKARQAKSIEEQFIEERP